MKKKLIGLQSDEYEHPFDRFALNNLRAIPAFQTVVSAVIKWADAQWNMVGMCGSNFHVTEEACPEVFNMFQRASQVIDVPIIPDLYFRLGPMPGAYTYGHANAAFIMVYSNTVDVFTMEEMSFLVGRELGHIKSEHVVLQRMIHYLGSAINKVTLGFGKALNTPLYFWNRMSEFTADRAGLLVCQDLDVALSAIMKISGLPQSYSAKVPVDTFKKQAEEFDRKYGNAVDKMIKTVSILTADQPWNVLRASELIKWVKSGEYDQILNSHKTKTCPKCEFEVSMNAERCPKCDYTWEKRICIITNLAIPFGAEKCPYCGGDH